MLKLLNSTNWFLIGIMSKYQYALYIFQFIWSTKIEIDTMDLIKKKIPGGTHNYVCTLFMLFVMTYSYKAYKHNLTNTT